MTLNDLEQAFVDGCYRSILTNREELPEKAHRRAGLKAVVEALRDEMQTFVCEGSNVTEQCCGQAVQDVEGMACCGRPDYVVLTDDVLNMFHEILASDAGGSE